MCVCVCISYSTVHFLWMGYVRVCHKVRYVTMLICNMLCMPQKGSRCIPNPNPVHKELSTVTYLDCDTKESRCNPVRKELSIVTYCNCDAKGSRCHPNPNPVQKKKKLSTVTYQDYHTTDMVHNGLVTHRTL